jgi:hypothetical protein
MPGIDRRAIVSRDAGHETGGLMATIDAFRDPRVTVIYGVDSCNDTTRARARFSDAGRSFRYVNLDHVPEVRDGLHALGHRATPVVVPPAGDAAVEPSDETLDAIIAASA